MFCSLSRTSELCLFIVRVVGMDFSVDFGRR